MILGAGWPAVLQARAVPVLPLPPLGEHLPRLLAGCGLPAANLGLCVTRVDSARVVAAMNGDTPFVMASTTKVVTSLAALNLLGQRWRWRTHAFATGPIVGGRLLGDLLIVGGGDPRLSPAELRQWLQLLRDRGLHEVRGDLVVDRSAFHLQEQDHTGTPLPGPERPHHARPDALGLDAALVRVQVQPSRGRMAQVHSDPPLDASRLLNRVASGGNCSAVLHWQGPPGPQQLVVEGQWGASCGLRQFSLPVPVGTSLAAPLVAGLWRDVGGQVLGRVREGDLSAGQPEGQRLPLLGADGEPLLPLSTHLSPPLPEVVHEINKTSNNVAARHLMLSLSRGFPAQPATLARARERLQQWLLRQGLGRGDIELDNGSGLSRAERGKPRALVHLLRRAWADDESRTFVDSLPVAGVDGTLAHRMQGGAAAGQAFLKTGTLLDTRALAGYVRSRSGQVYAVAVFVNHPEAGRATPSIDAVIEHLARHG
ncbi:MAG: D-alanyl-D-alanine carboxypeptidase/D-alanyl-D-alanine-endopeptidase [Pseudomonadota bacterium]